MINKKSKIYRLWEMIPGFFAWTAILFPIWGSIFLPKTVAYFVIAKMIDVVLKGLEETYSVMIVTSQHMDILNRLMLEMDKGVTVLHGEGGYTKEKRKILYCVVTRLEIDKLKNMVLDIDEGAFVTINPVSDIVGGRLRVKKNH